jgi:nucleoid-associated protein YgaU
MSEPVVIFGPAVKPSRQSAKPAPQEETPEAEDTETQAQDEPEAGATPKSTLLRSIARLATGFVGLLLRALWTIARTCLAIARRYPRHSLGAVVSIIILVAISIYQLPTGKGTRGPVTNKIPGSSPADAAKDGKNAGAAKPEGLAAASGQSTGTNVENSSASNSGSGLTTRSDASAPMDGSAPAPAAATKEDGAPPLPALAATPGVEPAPGKSVSAADATAALKVEGALKPSSAHEDSTPTLLATTPTDPAPSPAAKDEKGGSDPGKPAPALDAPAPTRSPALTSATDLPTEPPPLPAAIGGDVPQLATSKDRAGEANKSAQTSAPSPLPQDLSKKEPDSAGGTGKVEIKLPKVGDAAEPPVVSNHTSAHESNAAQQPVASPRQPEPTKKDPINSETPKSDAPKVDEPKPAIEGSSRKPEESPAPSPPIELPVPDRASAGADKPAGASPLPRVDGASAAAPSAESRPAMPAPLSVPSETPIQSQSPNSDAKPESASPKSPVDEPKDAEQKKPAPTRENTETRPQDSNTMQGDAGPKHQKLDALTTEGWVLVPNSGKLPIEGVGDADSPRAVADNSAALEGRSRDVRAHAAKDVAFEAESPHSRGTQDIGPSGQRSAAATNSGAQLAQGSASGRVESVPHVVEPNENFWTISRLYYSSGRYYRALWKANAEKYPDIEKLTVGDVIMVPPVEDLDPAQIDPPRSRAPVALRQAAPRVGGRNSRNARVDEADMAEGSGGTSVAEPTTTARTNRAATDGVPVRRSSRTDPDLDLPAPEAVSQRERAPERAGRRSDVALGNDDASSDEPETRTAARPRATGSAPLSRPAYKVRPYDTLRSIARDTLGDSHRVNEILDLNRDLIDDPTHLIVGQMLELPDDARTSVRRSTDRR